MLKTAPLPTKLEKKYLVLASGWIVGTGIILNRNYICNFVCLSRLEYVVQQQMIYLRHFVQNV